VDAHGLAHPHPIADRNGAGAWVHADYRADQEIPALVLGLVLVDHDPEQEAFGRQGLLVVVEVFDHLAEAVEGGLRRELRDHVALGAGDRHLGAYRRRALRDARQHFDAAEAYRHRALVDHVGAEEQAGGALGRRAREPAEHGHRRARVVQVSQERIRRERSRVCEHDHRVAQVGRVLGQPSKRHLAAGHDARELHGLDLGLRGGQGPDDCAVLILELLIATDHPACAAADQCPGREPRVDDLEDALRIAQVSGPGEDHAQVAAAVKPGSGIVGGSGERLRGVLGVRDAD
jgi:hypothetical protein